MCSIGEHLGVECPLQPLYRRDDFSKDEWKCLRLRCGRSSLETVCELHKLNFLTIYEKRQLVCCNPLPNRHLRGPVKGTKSISLSLYKKAKNILHLVPGKKLCNACMGVISNLVGDTEETLSSQSPENIQAVCEAACPDDNPAVVPANVETEDSLPVAGPSVSPVSNPGTTSGSPILGTANPVVGRLRTRVSQAKESSSENVTPDNSQSLTGSSGSPGFVPPEERLDYVNELLKKLGCSEVNKHKLKFEANYGSQKLKEMVDACQSILQENAENKTIQPPLSEEMRDFQSLVNCLKEKFVKAETSSEKILILSVFPPTWSIEKFKQELGPLGASDYLIRKSKALVKERGVLTHPNSKPGRPLNDKTVLLVKEFYEREDISSRQMPGCKDYVSVYENNIKIQKQKRMLLSNLKSLHAAYMEQYGETNPVGFSKFAQLRPKHCVFAGAPGTHSVCVCVYHENMNLMFEGSRLKEASSSDEKPLTNFKDCFNYIICEKPTPECYLRKCKTCPSPDAFQSRVESLFEENMVENVTYRGWFKVEGRYTLEKVIKPVAEFIDIFIGMLNKLLPHHFITKRQSEFYQRKKEDLAVGEVLVISDFAENYSCIMQSEVQGYHWSNEQITLHPFVAYFRNPSGELTCLSYVAVTDHKKHVTSTFYAFQKKFVPYLKKKLEDQGLSVQKIYYFSDGSSAQYKNRKNVKNICCHADDFGVQVEWHFFASCHGKGPCDGIGGTVKRCALRASLQGTIIRSAFEMCEWGNKNITSIKFDYFSVEEVNAVTSEQEERFKNVETVSGIAAYHSVIPQSPSSVNLKEYSASDKTKLVYLVKTRTFVPWNILNVSNHILIVSNDKWKLAEIKEKKNEEKQLIVRCLEPPGRARIYKHSNDNTDVTIPWQNVLSTTEPKLSSHSMNFTVPAKDKNAADRELKLYLDLGGYGVPPDEAMEVEENIVDDPDMMYDES